LRVEVSNEAAVAGGVAMGSRRGLAGMRERVEIFGGTLDAGPRSGGGWKLRATFPVSP
jgi:signal transduction histidine kinase